MSNESNYYTLQIKWSDILDDFTHRYCNYFLSKDHVKLHLDISEVVVDGAKDSWKYILFLDTMICFYKGLDKPKHECKRRFDQFHILKDCLVNACSIALVKQQLETTSNNLINKQLNTNINVIDIPNDWLTIDGLTTYLLINCNQSMKSFRKRRDSVILLINSLASCLNETITCHDFFNIVFNMIYRKYFINGIDASINRSIKTIPTKKQAELLNTCTEIMEYAMNFPFLHESSVDDK